MADNENSRPDELLENSLSADGAGGEALEVQDASLQAISPNGDAPPPADATETAPSTSGLVIETPDGQRTPALPYPVVAFGASAGGVSAFGSLLDRLPTRTGMTFVLVSHLAPDQKSHLTEIMERHTSMPVLPIQDSVRPLPNHVYVLEPNQIVQLREGAFHLRERAPNERFPTTIDIFFRSVAADQKNHAIGVVLSGADSDGALGLKAIKGEGGVAIVQSPESATHASMPRSSIAADHVDLVLPPGEIAIELGRIADQFGRPEVRLLDEGRVPEGEEQAYQRIVQLLRSFSGIEVRQYKPETIRRRIARRMLLLHKESLAEYHRFLQIRSDELRSLQEDILINVTRFFRDPEFWDALQTGIFPAVFHERRTDRPVRVWCAGCSTGEEAYSLAISLIEYISRNGLDMPIQIFGTDASDRSIEMARIGIYPETIAADVSPERIRRFFINTGHGYQVSKRVRDVCVFARQNLCNDPPFSHIDILSCRNVLIYFNLALQRQVLSAFHYALEPGGYMLLGLSEGLREYSDVFTAVDRKAKIYMKTGHRMQNGDSVHSYVLRTPDPAADLDGVPPPREGVSWPELELQRTADRIVLARYGPAGLIIDELMNVLQTRGHLLPYLQLLPGAVSWNLRRVVREDVFNHVRGFVQRSIQENIPVSSSFSTFDEENGEQQIHVDVLPITNSVIRERCFLILFQSLEKAEWPRPIDAAAPPQLTGDEKDRVISQLRQDPTSTRFHLQSLIEERDARHQELISANEEIQSANEELQSTNEELETTKEELQSANEELQTVNEELQQRNASLAQTSNDLANLLNSVNIPLLMLTSDFHIRQFTPPMQRLFNVRPADVGRSISEIRLQLSVEDILPILQDVHDTLGTREMEVQDRNGKWYLMRVRPYRTSEDKIEGLVLVLLDIDQLRSSQQNLVEARDFAASVLETVPVPVVVLNQDCTIRTVNTAFRELARLPARELVGRSMPDLMQLLWAYDELGPKLSALLESGGPDSFEFEHTSTIFGRQTLLVKARLLADEGNRALLLTLEDINRRREAEEMLASQKQQLENEYEQATRQLDRTQEELRRLTAHLFTAQEEERQKVSSELHDDISQRLSALELILAEAQKNKGDPARIETAREQLQTLNTDVRSLSHRLHPAILEDLGLSTALKAMAEEFGHREHMPATYVGRDLPEILPQPAVTAIYRIAQEALRNVSKHAGKTHVKIILEARDGLLHLEVRDLGIGFDREAELDGQPHGLGLISMKERARLAHGTLSIVSSLGEGTTVIADIPFERDAQHA